MWGENPLLLLSPHTLKETIARGTNERNTIVEQYLTYVRRIIASGGATGQLSIYPALNELFNAVGATLRPTVFAVQGLANQ